MEESNDRPDRVEQILREMAARQQYHDKAFERFDARRKADAEGWRERTARHEEWLTQHNEHLARQAEYLDRMADQINAALLRVTDSINKVAALTSQNAIQIDKLSEAWLYHNKRINALEERQAS